MEIKHIPDVHTVGYLKLKEFFDELLKNPEKLKISAKFNGKELIAEFKIGTEIIGIEEFLAYTIELIRESKE